MQVQIRGDTAKRWLRVEATGPVAECRRAGSVPPATPFLAGNLRSLIPI